MATGEVRGAFSITEPHAGSDVQAIKVRAVRDGDAYVVDGHKKWITNGLHAGVIMLLAVTDPDAQPRHRGFTCLVVEKEPLVHEQPGLTIPPLLKKMGYLGIDSTEMFWEGFRVPADMVLGGQEGQGFKQFMAALELGRVNVAARGLGLARSAFDHAIAYADERETFGKPIADHQSIQIKLAQMATRSGRPSCSCSTRPSASRPASAPTSRRGWRSSSRPRRARSARSTRCGSTAARATRRDQPGRAPLPRRAAADPRRGVQEIQHLIIARRLLEARRNA